MSAYDPVAEGGFDVEVYLGDLEGSCGNAYVVLGRFKEGLDEVPDLTADQIETIMADARSGDYLHLLRTVDKYVQVEAHPLSLSEFIDWYTGVTGPDA